MSLVITTTTPEGIVIGADSRQSFRNRRGMARIGSDNAKKLFQINSRVGVAITGLAFLEEEGVQKNISYFINDFRKDENIESYTVKEVAEKIYALLKSKYKPDEKLLELENKINVELKQKGFTEIKFTKENHILKYQFTNTLDF